MKLVTFSSKKDLTKTKIGSIYKDVVIDFSSADLPTNMIDFIRMGDKGLDIANDYVHLEEGGYFMDDIILKCPILNPNKILAVGLNYKKHLEEAKDLKDHHSNNVQIQEEYPTIFNKQNSSINDPYGDVHLPQESDSLDYEGEMGFIISKQCRHVPYKNAKDCIFGYTIVNDFTIRDWQFRGPPHTMTMGKSWDTHCPFGPCIVTADEIQDPHNLSLKTYVNNEEKQNTNTNLMTYDCFNLVEYITTAFSLMPGDLIATGTPEGSALASQNWLKSGDRIRVEIDKIGFIENSIINEPKSTTQF